MPARKKESGIRSGRFKLDALMAGPVDIILEKKGNDAYYRFLNGGEKTFNVVVTTDGADEEFPIEKNCALDLLVAAGSVVSISKLAANDEIEGAYDLHQVQKGIRSGRFKLPREGAPLARAIIKGGAGRIYRLFNSGLKKIVVGVNGGTPEVKQQCSFDVYLDTQDLTIIQPAANEAIQGVFDLVEIETDVRSGRFKSSDASLPIIDFTVAGTVTPKSSYRIYNSGINKFNVKRGATDLGVVEADSSIDIELPANQNANRKIIIEKIEDLEYTGVYEYLGVLGQ